MPWGKWSPAPDARPAPAGRRLLQVRVLRDPWVGTRRSDFPWAPWGARRRKEAYLQEDKRGWWMDRPAQHLR